MRTIYVECKPDETLVVAMGVERRDVIHAAGSRGVCAQLARHQHVTGMLDEDPGAAHPSYMSDLVEESWEHGVRFFWDQKRENRVIVLSPRLEEWLAATCRSAGLKMTEFGFESDVGVNLHGEINQRLNSLKNLLEALLNARNPRILRLQSLLVGSS